MWKSALLAKERGEKRGERRRVVVEMQRVQRVMREERWAMRVGVRASEKTASVGQGQEGESDEQRKAGRGSAWQTGRQAEQQRRIRSKEVSEKNVAFPFPFPHQCVQMQKKTSHSTQSINPCRVCTALVPRCHRQTNPCPRPTGQD